MLGFAGANPPSKRYNCYIANPKIMTLPLHHRFIRSSFVTVAIHHHQVRTQKNCSNLTFHTITRLLKSEAKARLAEELKLAPAHAPDRRLGEITVIRRVGFVGSGIELVATPHPDYVAKPLQAMGVEVGTYAKGKLAQAIANDNYHVLVVATMNDAERQAVDSFLARGGGVLVCNPNWSSVEGDFEKTCQWLASKGARPRWDMLKDSNPSNIVQVTFGALSWSDGVSAPVQDGVRGVLTVLFS
jgi:hypothetical protein